MGFRENFGQANRQAKRLRSAFPTALAVRYDRRLDRVVIRLSSGLDVAFSPRNAQGLQNAKLFQLRRIEISPSGFGIYFPDLDADIYLPAILQGFLGSRKWMASRLGQAGGKSRSTVKQEASRTNGKLGGRPREASRGGL